MIVLALLVAAVAPIDPLQSAFAAAHRDFTAQEADKFAGNTADPGAIGKHFKAVRPIKDGDAYSGLPGDAFYTYEGGKLRLQFSVADRPLTLLMGSPRHMVGAIGGRRTTLRHYVGSNAYGATRRVEVVQLDTDSLAMLDRPQGEVSPYEAKIRANDPPAIQADMPPPDRNTYFVELQLPGPQARKVALDAVLVVEGTIQALDDGRLNLCKSDYSRPEIDAPIEIYGSECWIGANVSRIAFIRRSTGEVLKEWTK